jgi:hypothetical protein
VHADFRKTQFSGMKSRIGTMKSCATYIISPFDCYTFLFQQRASQQYVTLDTYECGQPGAAQANFAILKNFRINADLSTQQQCDRPGLHGPDCFCRGRAILGHGAD